MPENVPSICLLSEDSGQTAQGGGGGGLVHISESTFSHVVADI